MIDIATGILSDLIVFSKYAKYDKEKNRRETWEENSLRLRNMYLNKFPQFSDDINEAFDYDKDRKVLASMRSHQFGGKPIEMNNARLYNCSFVNITCHFHFSEILFLLLSGTGVGFSVQSRHINNLPQIIKPQTTRKYVIGDSIEGWADSVRSLVKAYFKGTPLPIFDYSDIRQKGLPLVTSGGKAPGPEPLKNCLEKINSLLSSKEEGSKLSSIEVHDIVCHLADAVLSGGIRRAALISIFDSTDNDMLKAKSYHSCVPYNGGFKYDESSDTYSGQVKYEGKIHTVYLSSKEYKNFNEYGKLAWYWFNPQRARANNSVVLFKKDLPEFGITATTKEEYESIWKKCEKSNAGEPGILWSNHPDYAVNPCSEISLFGGSFENNNVGGQFCNLCEINISLASTQEELEEMVRVATLIGTLQATYTDFHYLNSDWKKNTKKEALLGISFTGIADCDYKKFDLKKAAEIAKLTNELWASNLGIKKSARITTTKPAGTSSLILGTSSGIHGRHAPFYIRRIRYNKDEPIAIYLQKFHPEIIEQDVFSPTTIVVSIPQKSPQNSIFRNEDPIDLLERIKYFYENWILPGHVSGPNTHNISCTVSLKNDEWEKVGNWMWDNRDNYVAISVLPYDGGNYLQPPFEDTTEEIYNNMILKLKNLDITKVLEDGDYTDLQGELSCSGNACEVTYG